MSRRAPSRISRLARLGGLTGRISSSYIGERVRDAFRNREKRKEALDRLYDGWFVQESVSGEVSLDPLLKDLSAKRIERGK